MLIMITSKCNMSCEHCCMSCGKNYKGEHMELNVYSAALDLAAVWGDHVVLSGGEPTLHPDFKQYLAMAVDYSQTNGVDIKPWLATNGSKKTTALWLAKYSGENSYGVFEGLYQHAFIQPDPDGYYFDASLSLDVHHDRNMVHPDVIHAFSTIKNNRTGEGIRDVTGGEQQAGHWTGNSRGHSGCVCSTIQVKPNGDVFTCGCDHAPRLGNVTDGDIEDIVTFYLDNFEDCIDHPSADRSGDYEDVEEVMQALKNRLPELYYNRQWADDHIKVRPSKVDHPETYRISLERKTELSEYKEL